MPISRRGFLGCAAAASAAGLAGAAGPKSLFAAPADPRSGCLLVDPGPRCPLAESATGYAAALTSSKIAFRQTSFQSFTFASARTVILPAAVTVDFNSAARLREDLLNGSTVLYESGAAFASPRDFGFHKHVIRSVFGLSLHDPVRLWDSADSLKQYPYVDYHWPAATKVRDFSRVLPVNSADGETIATFRNLPVATKLRIGKGTLVYLGSPLGPHLMSGDREASRWLRMFCSS